LGLVSVFVEDESFKAFTEMCERVGSEPAYTGKTKIIQHFITRGTSGSGFTGVCVCVRVCLCLCLYLCLCLCLCLCLYLCLCVCMCVYVCARVRAYGCDRQPSALG
jgi:hypothetical protein